MSTPFSRSRLARLLGVTPGRVSQMQSSGEIAKPEIELDEKTSVWPATYGESIIAKRAGRQVSASVYGFVPPAEPAIRVADALVQAGKYWCFAQKFETPSGVIVLATQLRQPSSQTLPGLAPLKASSVNLGDRETVDLMRTIADELLEGDVFGAAWVWWSDSDGWRHDLKELVLVDEGREDFAHAWDPRPASGQRIETNDLSYVDLAGKLGRAVPLFPRGVAVPSVVEQWRSSGRQRPVEVLVDSQGLEQRAACASIVANLPGLDRDQQGIACRALLRHLRWEASGEIDKGAWQYLIRLEDAVHVESLAVTRQPDLEHYRSVIGEEMMSGEPPTQASIQSTMNRLSDLLEYTYGEFGETPDYRAAFAIGEALVYLRSESEVLDTKDRAVVKKFRVIRDFEPSRSRLWSEYRQTLRPLDNHGRNAPAVRELDKLEVFSLAGQPRLLQDAVGTPVLASPTRWRSEEQIERLDVAVPVLNEDSKETLGKDFLQICVAADTQSGPAFIRTPRGLQVMPLEEPSTAGYTHGYGGTGPSNLNRAILGFLDWVSDGSFTDEGRQRLWSIIVSSHQGQELVIDRSNILGPGSVQERAS